MEDMARRSQEQDEAASVPAARVVEMQECRREAEAGRREEMQTAGKESKSSLTSAALTTSMGKSGVKRRRKIIRAIVESLMTCVRIH